jgi:2-keto-4-pentenoate hydratase
MTLTAGPGANEYTYSLTVNKSGQAASGSAENLQLTMTIADNAANTSSTTVNVPVTVNDDIAPVISFTSVPASVTALSSQGRVKTFTVSYTVSDSTEGNPPASRVSLAQKGSAAGVTLSIGATQKSGATYFNVVIVIATGFAHNGLVNF